MTTEHTHPHTDAVPFTEAEINTFHADDRKQAGFVVALIASIFVTGVIIYTTVATAVAWYPHQ